MFKKILAIAALAFTFALPALATTPVNINTADAETITKSLSGIGLTKAKAIVAFREEHGPFKSVDDLTQVKGIGPATLEKNRENIQLSGENGAKAEAEAPAKPKHPKKAKPAANEETQ
jgi:competence protein ComEA